MGGSRTARFRFVETTPHRPADGRLCAARLAQQAGLVGRGELAGLLHRHFGIVALDSALAGLGAEHHRAADLALIPSTQLVGHLRTYS